MPDKEKDRNLFKLFCKWSACTLCPIGKRAENHVFWKGDSDAKVVFVGEGPGRSEDVLGQPFVGRSGKLLAEAIRRAGKEPKSLGYTNLVCCRPSDNYGGENRAPTEREVLNCTERLVETLQIVAPKVVVWLGKVPQSHAVGILQDAGMGEIVSVYLPHPSWILRNGGVGTVAFDGYVLKLKEIFDGYA